MPTAQDYCIEAARELGVVNAVDPLSPEDTDLMLGKLNRIFDNWNADQKGIYAFAFQSYTLTPNLQPHTIGPSGATFTFATNRPNKIYGANLVLNTVTPNLNQKLNIVSSQWWLDQPVPTLTSQEPTELYYDPVWPNGSIYLWPVPTVAYGLQLQLQIALAQVTLASTITLPPGYHDGLVLTLAEDSAVVFKIQPAPMLMKKAREARARIFAANDWTPPLATRDAGMPQSGESRTRTSFNYRTRQWGG